jgi:thymidylate synthase (FAD)
VGLELIPSSYSLEYIANKSDLLQFIEKIGRTAYKSESSLSPTSSQGFIKSIIKAGHESVLEHSMITVRFICDRGVTHELVRHRLAAFTQESTRYVNYFKRGMVFIEPPSFKLDDEDIEFLKLVEAQYNRKIRQGYSPQIARYFLIQGIKTEIVVTTNIREWRHILQLRVSKFAHPDISFLMSGLLKDLKSQIPILFDDLSII